MEWSRQLIKQGIVRSITWVDKNLSIYLSIYLSICFTLLLSYFNSSFPSVFATVSFFLFYGLSYSFAVCKFVSSFLSLFILLSPLLRSTGASLSPPSLSLSLALWMQTLPPALLQKEADSKSFPVTTSHVDHLSLSSHTQLHKVSHLVLSPLTRYLSIKFVLYNQSKSINLSSPSSIYLSNTICGQSIYLSIYIYLYLYIYGYGLILLSLSLYLSIHFGLNYL
ncbi:unnamed protein product [Acanthosepion pharaonis]|uniref:Uncharacterized protein n=1 Tax=Acanthosepion pharaonis TaxID=158019 RepID=A0A812C621_ACAPH|nr:unnamed protein product [Sepia pharaonis]